MEVAASIAGLVALADLVFGKVFTYIKAVKNAEKDISAFSIEIRSLSGILHSLHLLACQLEDGNYDRAIRVHHIFYCHETLERIKKKLQKSQPEGEASRSKDLLRKLKWPFSAGETKELIAEIQRHKSTMSLALAADNLSSLLTALGRQEIIEAGINDIKIELRNRWYQENRAALSTEQRQTLTFFCPVNPQSSHEMSLSLRHPGTGLWCVSVL
jgi:hypothetical protein